MVSSEEKTFCIMLAFEKSEPKKELGAYWEYGTEDECREYLKDLEKSHTVLKVVRLPLDSSHHDLLEYLDALVGIFNPSDLQADPKYAIARAFLAGVKTGFALKTSKWKSLQFPPELDQP